MKCCKKFEYTKYKFSLMNTLHMYLIDIQKKTMLVIWEFENNHSRSHSITPVTTKASSNCCR